MAHVFTYILIDFLVFIFEFNDNDIAFEIACVALC